MSFTYTPCRSVVEDNDCNSICELCYCDTRHCICCWWVGGCCVREMMMILMKMMQCYRGCLNVEQTGPVWSNRLLALNNLGKLHQCVCVMPAHVCAHLCIRRKTAVLSNNSFSQIHYFFLVLGYLCITYISINIIRRFTFEVVAPLYMFFSCMPHIPSSIHTPMLD